MQLLELEEEELRRILREEFKKAIKEFMQMRSLDEAKQILGY